MPLAIAAALIAGLAFWLWCVIRVTKAGVRPLPPGETEHLRGQTSVRCTCDCGCFLRCELPEELAQGLCAFCIADVHVCDHGNPFCVECADCDAFTNVIRIDAPRGAN